MKAEAQRPPLPASLLVTVWSSALLLRAVAAARCESLTPDGAVDLAQARAWSAGDLHGALDPGFSPLLGALSGGLHRLLGVPLEATALVLVVLGSSLVAPAAACAAADLWPRAARRAAFAAGMLAAVQPYLVRLGGQVMGYGLAHGLVAVAAALTVRALVRDSARSAGAAGAVLGLGFLARADALTSGAGLGLALVVCGRKRGPQLLAFGLAALLVATPYLLLLRWHHGEWRLSGRKTVARLTGPTPTSLGTPPPETLRALVAEEAVGDEGRPRTPTPIGGWWGATTYAVGKVASAAVLPLLLLALAGAALSRAPPAHAWALATFLVGQILLRANYGYTGRTHASGAAALVPPLAAVTWAAIPWRRLGARRGRRLAVLSLACLCVALLPKALDPQQAGRGPQAEVGAWVRAELGDGPREVWGIDARVVAHYAGASYRDTPTLAPEDLVAQARGARVRLLVVALRHRAPRPGALDEALQAAGAARIDPGFASQVGKTHYRWLVFRLPGSG